MKLFKWNTNIFARKLQKHFTWNKSYLQNWLFVILWSAVHCNRCSKLTNIFTSLVVSTHIMKVRKTVQAFYVNVLIVCFLTKLARFYYWRRLEYVGIDVTGVLDSIIDYTFSQPYVLYVHLYVTGGVDPYNEKNVAERGSCPPSGRY